MRPRDNGGMILHTFMNVSNGYITCLQFEMEANSEYRRDHTPLNMQ